MLYTEAPADFNPSLEAVGCFSEHDSEIILLQKNGEGLYPLLWGIPSGKVKPGESSIVAMVREHGEETGLWLPHESFAYFAKAYVRFPKMDFVYHVFHTKFEGEKPIITVNLKEHQNSTWKQPKAALEMPLIEDLDACIHLFYGTQ